MLRLASRSRCSRASTAARRRKIKLSQNSTCAKKDRKSTRLNSSHGYISYAVFCLKKKNHVRPFVELILLVLLRHTSFDPGPLQRLFLRRLDNLLPLGRRPLFYRRSLLSVALCLAS